MSQTRVEYRPLPERPVPGEMRTPELVTEFASLKVWFAVNETDRPIPAGRAHHNRLKLVVDELRNRGALDR